MENRSLPQTEGKNSKTRTEKQPRIRAFIAIGLVFLIGGFIILSQSSLAEGVFDFLKPDRAGTSSFGYGFRTSPARVITGTAFARNHLLGWNLSGTDLSADRDTTLANVFPFGSDFNGGIFVTTGDVTGDGIDEIGIASATVGSHVLVLNKDGTRRPIDFFPFGSGGGVNIDMGDVDGDGKAEIAMGTNDGVGNVKVYRYNAERTIVGNWKPYGEVVTRVKVALGDIDADGVDEVITGAAATADGPSVTPHIRVFESDGTTKPIQFSAFGPIEDITAGDIDGDGKDEIIVSSGSRVKVYRYNNTQTVLADITVYPAEFGVAARVDAYDVDQDGKGEIITGTSRGGGPQVRVWEVWDGKAGMLSSFMAYDTGWRNGVDIAGGLFQ